MILCSGSCSGERAIRGKRTPAGKTDFSAPREKDYCAVFASLAARSTTKILLSYARSPNSILTGSRHDELCKTSTFTRRLRTPGE